jgi:hypothetical protein
MCFELLWLNMGRDVMSHSFGEGYATRSDEEGFGGIYGGNQSFPKPEHDEPVHENHPGKIHVILYL